MEHWTLSERMPAVLAESKNAIKGQSIQVKKNALKLWKKFLQQKYKEQVSYIDEED